MTKLSLHEKCPYLEFFWSVLSRIRTEYGKILRIPLRIQSECGKIRSRKTPNTDTFHAVYTICDALGDLVPFVQFKKRKKHSWRSVTFSKLQASA